MNYVYVDSPIGAILVAGDERAIHQISFTSGPKAVGPEANWSDDPGPLRPAVGQLAEYFAGERREFDLELVMNGTEFQQLVWQYLRTIPHGEVRSYGEVARALGRPGSSRAVGRANATNPLPIVVPCHRVIGADGTLTGFGGGLRAKQWLLRFEGARLPARQNELF